MMQNSDADDCPIMTSMGMLIIDENEYPASWNREPEVDIIGGGGPYTIVGGRIIAGVKYGKRICGIIDQGYDFPPSMLQELKGWNCGLIFREDKNRKTTRGKNIYTVDNIRLFEYKSEKKQITAEDIISNEILAKSKSIHLLCSFDRCLLFINQISLKNPETIFLFEPLPSDCILDNFNKLKTTLSKITIFTPNLDEASELTNLPKSDLIGITNLFLKFLPPNGGVVLRCGSEGCFINTNDNSLPPFSLPAYHQNQSKVIDVTGGGNSYCGAFMTGFYLSNFDWKVAAICGNLASGCIIEKLGMPQYNLTDDTWNGENLNTRLDTYLKNNPDLNIDKSKFSWIYE